MRTDQCECGTRGLVYQTEQADGVTVRRRKCPSCKTTWTTREVDGRLYVKAPHRGSMAQTIDQWPQIGGSRDTR